MKITICGSIFFSHELINIAEKLKKLGHETELPLTTLKIKAGELTLDEYKKEKEASGDGSFRKMHDNVIKRYYNLIRESDAILVCNFTKNEIKNYIGGNTFLEIGFAHVLDKKIFLLNGLPEMHYSDEIKAMQPIVISGDLSRIALSHSGE